MKPRLLMVGTAYAIKEHRKKLDYIANDFALTCVTARECGGFGWLESTAANESGAGYRLIGLALGGASVAGTRCWYRGLAKVFREESYDLILVENEPWGILRWQSWLLKACFQPQARFGEFTWENVERAGWKGKVLSLVYRLAAWSSSFVIGGNHEAGAIMRRRGSAPETVASLPQFGVDPLLFCPLGESERQDARAALAIPRDAFLIGYCGRLVPEKGIRCLMEAFHALEDPERRIHLLIMGTGELEEEVREASRRDPRIHFQAASTYPEIASVLQLLDLCVLPSQTSLRPGLWWKEQFGHILIETMACEVATIGSNCGAIPEVLNDPEAVFAEGDVPALTNLMQSLIQDGGSLRQLGARQRKRVLEVYTHQRVGEMWSAFLLKHLPDKKRSRLA
ncbi:MAG: glycosyltransferase [Verrucomicrobiota bacterium]